VREDAANRKEKEKEESVDRMSSRNAKVVSEDTPLVCVESCQHRTSVVQDQEFWASRHRADVCSPGRAPGSAW